MISREDEERWAEVKVLRLEAGRLREALEQVRLELAPRSFLSPQEQHVLNIVNNALRGK